MSKRPTNCKELVPGMPGYIGYCDACQYGAGGVWLSGSLQIHPIVWRIKWPDDVIKRFVSSANPKGDISINDLEMAGLLLHYLLLEQIVDLKHVHTAAWCDNKSTVSWATK